MSQYSVEIQETTPLARDSQGTNPSINAGSKSTYAFLDEGNKSFVEAHFTKGNVSNYITFVLMIIGFIIRNQAHEKVGDYILAIGLFGFSGGITNWLAVKMLFDKIPFIYGSGVIPSRFKEIRKTVKDTIMATFFDQEYLDKYIHQKAQSFKEGIDIVGKFKEMLESPKVDELLTAELNALSTKPEESYGEMNVGMMFAMMGISPIQLKPLIKPFLVNMGAGAAPILLDQLDISSMVSIERVRTELDALMTTKLEELTPEIVKKLIEKVIRDHLGWLIVWGNVFGGFIGLIAQIVNDLS